MTTRDRTRLIVPLASVVSGKAPMHTLILASASPRRKDLLEQIGIHPVICPSTEEEQIQEKSPEKTAAGLAKAKCISVTKRYSETDRLMPDLFFLGADTIVVHDGVILGKPKDPQEAEHMLSCLQGATHSVITGVAVLRAGISGILSFDNPEAFQNYAVRTEVTVAPMDHEEIRNYVATNDPLDKAGAYGIQGLFARYISRIQGEYANVVGLPVAEVYHTLKEMGFFSDQGGIHEER